MAKSKAKKQTQKQSKKKVVKKTEVKVSKIGEDVSKKEKKSSKGVTGKPIVF